MYTKEKKLVLTRQVALTKKCYDLLRKEKKTQGISMAKIVCNLIIKNFLK